MGRIQFESKLRFFVSFGLEWNMCARALQRPPRASKSQGWSDPAVRMGTQQQLRQPVGVGVNPT